MLSIYTKEFFSDITDKFVIDISRVIYICYRKRNKYKTFERIVNTISFLWAFIILVMIYFWKSYNSIIPYLIIFVILLALVDKVFNIHFVLRNKAKKYEQSFILLKKINDIYDFQIAKDFDDMVMINWVKDHIYMLDRFIEDDTKKI